MYRTQGLTANCEKRTATDYPVKVAPNPGVVKLKSPIAQDDDVLTQKQLN
jgi:hypothetical protein